MRWKFNFFPAYRGTGGRITYIAADYSEIRIRLPLNWRTRNYVGTIFGGSMYGAVDPIYMIMLIKRLGSEYVVWDKAAGIRFRRPGRQTLIARFVISDNEVGTIKAILQTQLSVDRTYEVELLGPEGTVCAAVQKVVYVARSPSWRQPLADS